MARIGQVGVAYRYYFNVHRGGAPRTGLVLANFDISVRNPQNTFSDVPAALTEVGNGRYFFDVLAAFSTTHGAGQYHANIEVILAPFSLGGGPIEFYAESIDTVARRSEYTAARAGFLDELDAPNIPADVDTLLARLTVARAANLDEITAVRLAELDAANLPADIDSIIVGIALVLSTGGPGPWTGLPGVSDWTATERNQIRERLGIDGTQAVPATVLGLLPKLREALVATELVVAAAPASTSAIINTDAGEADDFYDDMMLVIRNGSTSAARRIVSYANAGGAFTVDPPFPFTPSNPDVVFVLNELGVVALAQAVVEGVFVDPDVIP